MNPPVIILDTETLGLSLSSPIWEIAALRIDSIVTHDDDGFHAIERQISQLHMFVHHDSNEVAGLPPQFSEDYFDRFSSREALTTRQAEGALEQLFEPRDGQKPHLVGAVPGFDEQRLIYQGLAPEPPDLLWHYHVIDIETLAVGFLKARGVSLTLPWDSEDLSRQVGVEPNQFSRHQAMADVQWAYAIFQAVMDGPMSAVADV